jgi:hypothetical protein
MKFAPHVLSEMIHSRPTLALESLQCRMGCDHGRGTVCLESPQLVDVRRQACPRARWNAQQRAWTMTDADGEAFLAAGHAQLTHTRTNFEIAIDGER